MFLGPYEVIDTIGRGGMAVVLRARAKDGREVAVKVIQKARSAEMLARFERERRLLAALGEAEGFVPLLDSGESPQGPYLVMPFVGGGTLKKRLASGPLDIDDSIELVRELATAIGRAHAHGIVHRDVKPENVLFTLHGRPLIADLGLAKHFTASDHDSSTQKSISLSTQGELRGTAGYMPVEQMRDAKNVGPQADVFALGAILYECLTGVPAFQADDFYALMGKVERGEYVAVRKLRPATPRWLAALVDKALARRPEKRFVDGTALERALLAEGADEARRASHLVAAALGFAAVVATACAVTLLVRAPVALPASPPPPPTEDAAHLVASAAAKLARGDLDAARADLSRALELEPRRVSAWVLRARVRLRAGDLAAAFEDATRATTLAPSDPEGWIARGEVHLARRQEASAIEDLSRALALDSLRARAFALRAMAHARQQDQDAAREDAEKALALDPKLAEAWAARGEARSAAGDKRAAIQDLDRALELDPNDAHAFSVRGSARAQTGDLAGGLDDLTQAIQRDPKNAGAWHDRGIIRRLREEWDAAIEDASRAIELEPRHTNAWGNRAYCRYHTKDFEGAIFDYTKAIEIDPADVNAYTNRGAARAERKDWKGAEADFTKVIELEPGDGDNYKNRAVARLKAGDRKGAADDFARALELNPNGPEAAQMRQTLRELRGR